MDSHTTPHDPATAISDEREWQIVDMAKAMWHRDGECEIEDTAVVSEGAANGAYVQAWVWVDFAGTPFDKGTQEAG